MAAAEWRRPWACMAAVNCSSSKELSCREATSFSASWGTGGWGGAVRGELTLGLGYSQEKEDTPYIHVNQGPPHLLQVLQAFFILQISWQVRG